MNQTKKVNAIMLLGIAVAMLSSCLLPHSLGTPKEEIERKGGKIVLSPSGAVDVKLTDPQVGDVDLHSVVALCGNHSEYQVIRALDLSGSKVTDQGLKKLLELPSLEMLDVRHTKVTSPAVARFQERLPGCTVLWK